MKCEKKRITNQVSISVISLELRVALRVQTSKYLTKNARSTNSRNAQLKKKKKTSEIDECNGTQWAANRLQYPAIVLKMTPPWNVWEKNVLQIIPIEQFRMNPVFRGEFESENLYFAFFLCWFWKNRSFREWFRCVSILRCIFCVCLPGCVCVHFYTKTNSCIYRDKHPSCLSCNTERRSEKATKRQKKHHNNNISNKRIKSTIRKYEEHTKDMNRDQREQQLK